MTDTQNASDGRPSAPMFPRVPEGSGEWRLAGVAERDRLYAEWAAFDAARTERQEELCRRGLAASAEPMSDLGGGQGIITPVEDINPPRASQASSEPTVAGPSGRRYVMRETMAGTAYGLGKRSLLLVHGRHAIERRRPSWNLEGLVDRLTASLRVRAEAVENVRALVPEGDRPKLDAMLVRWFRHPGTWRGTRKRIERCIRYMNLDDRPERQAMKALNTMVLRGTWAT